MLVKILQADGALKAEDSKGNIIPFNLAGDNYPTIWKNTAQKAFDDDMSFVLENGKWSKIEGYLEISSVSKEGMPELIKQIGILLNEK